MSRRIDIFIKNILKIKRIILCFLVLINIVKIETLGLIQATEVEKCLCMSNIYNLASADTLTHLPQNEKFFLVRYIKKEDPVVDEKLFAPINHTLTEDHASKINYFVNNKDKITKYDNVYGIFYDILYLDITQNNIQDFIAKYLFIDLLNKIKGKKLHYYLSLLICDTSKKDRDECIDGRIDEWLDRFFIAINTILPKYYETNESIKQITNDCSKLFIKFDFNEPLFRTTFFEVIKTNYTFYQNNFNSYVKHDNKLFLTSDDACIELFPSLEKKSDDTLDFTLYPIKHARGWLYKNIYTILLKNYRYKKLYRDLKIGPEIGYAYVVFDGVQKIVIDVSDLKKMKLKKLLKLLPSLQKIILQTSTKKPLFLNSTESYILLKKINNMKACLCLKGIVISGQPIAIKGNVQVSTKNIIKSFIKFWVMPNDYIDDTCDYCQSGVCIFNILTYAIVLYNNIMQMSGNETLFYLCAPSAIFFLPFLLSDKMSTKIVWGKERGKFIGDHQHWTFYAWRQALICLINIYWIMKAPLLRKDDMLKTMIAVNYLVQICFLLGSCERLIKVIKVINICLQAKSCTPYIKKSAVL